MVCARVETTNLLFEAVWSQHVFAGVASDTNNKDMLNLLILSNVYLILESCQQKDYVIFIFSKRAKIQ